MIIKIIISFCVIICNIIQEKGVYSMFTRISVKNFKSLIDLDVDLSQKKKEPKSLVVIYGENGVGKSNFASIFYTLRESMETMSIKFILQRLMNSNLDEANHLQDKNFQTDHSKRGKRYRIHYYVL